MSKPTTRLSGTNWDPVVNVKFQGVTKAALSRKVVTTGIETVECEELLKTIAAWLRSGKEVRLGDAIRIYPCMDVGLKSMFPAAQTIGDFRNLLRDKKTQAIHCGKSVKKDVIVKKAKERNEEYKSNRIEVTPDTMVVCPVCGSEIRVGKAVNR